MKNKNSRKEEKNIIMKKGKLSKAASLFLSLMLVLTMVPSVGTDMAWAATTTLYIADIPGGTSETVTDSTTDTVGHWAWNAETATLTLDGFNGEYIASTGALNIVLKGTNTITMPSALTSSNVYGIDSTGEINISGDRADGNDSLRISQTLTSKSDSVNAVAIGVKDWQHPLTVTDCDIIIDMKSNIESPVSSGFRMVGISDYSIFNGTASLDLDISSSMYAAGISSSLKANTSGSIDIKVGTKMPEKITSQDNLLGVSGLDTEGRGMINVEAEGGCSIIDYLEIDKDAGDISFKGDISISKGRMTDTWYRFDIPGSKKIVKLDSEDKEVQGKCGFVYKEFSNSKVGYYLTDESGNLVSKGKIVTKADNPLTFMGSEEINLTGLKVGEVYHGNYINGLVSGGTKPYNFSIEKINEKDVLPEDLKVERNGDSAYYIYCKPTTTHNSGSFKIKVTDSAGASDTITVNYEAVTKPPKYVTVGDTKFSDDVNESGTNWTWKASTKTLTLNNCTIDGGIVSEFDEALNIVLNGINTITMPSEPTGSRIYGIKAKGAVNISGDDTGARDTLTISQDVKSNSDCYNIYGIYALDDDRNMKPITVNNCDLKIKLDTKLNGNAPTVGTYSPTEIKGNATLGIDIESGRDATGAYSSITSSTSGSIDIKVKTSKIDKSDLIGVGGLKDTGSGTINIEAEGGRSIIDFLEVAENAGEI